VGSPFSGLTPELPSTVVDRVHLKLTTDTPGYSGQIVPGADFLELLTAPGGAPGSAIKILERTEPVSEDSDLGIALLLWAAARTHTFEVGGRRFRIGVGWRLLYSNPPRYRKPGAPDAASFVWKLERVLADSSNQPLQDALGQNKLVERVVEIKGGRFIGVDAQGRCGEFLEGEVVYEALLDKDAV
jgi:hypothetical protein